MAGYWYTQAIYVAAQLRLADLLTDGPKAADELAPATGTSARPLYRLLRALASVEIFAEDSQRRFSLTPLAECLRSEVPGSLWSMAILRGGLQYEAWGQLLHSVQTGQSAFEKLHGLPIFEYFQQHAEDGKLFDAAMTGVHGRETAAMLDAYDFSDIGTLADIGGGNGSVLTAILQKYPAMQGILFDLPGVVERARANLEASGLSDRCRVVGGNFFEAVPPGADAYLMRHIIHDWDDEKSLTILRNCRKAMGGAEKLLVVEGVVLPDNQPSISKFFDLAMMVLPGGMERTEDEYRRLSEAAGFRLTRIVPTKTWISVIEGEVSSA
ncbi:MAG: methyltransferase [Planctomycetia bacterium]|nr:methyltransferase [Planctomycetia bacterium]